MWLPVLRVLCVVTQKGPATALSLTWSSVHMGRSLSIHTIYCSLCPNWDCSSSSVQIQLKAGLNYNPLKMLGYLYFSSTFHFLYVGIVALLVGFTRSKKVLHLGDFNWSGFHCFWGELWHTFSQPLVWWFIPQESCGMCIASGCVGNECS